MHMQIFRVKKPSCKIKKREKTVFHLRCNTTVVLMYLYCFFQQAGLIGLTKTLAVDESKFGVRVNRLVYSIDFITRLL